MKESLFVLLFASITLQVFSQEYFNIRIIQSRLSIYNLLPDTEEDWPLGDSTYRSPIEDGFAGNIRYRSQFIFNQDSVCVVQRTIFITNSTTRVDSLLREMKFLKIEDNFADSLLRRTDDLKIEDEYFGETEECYLRAYMRPELMDAEGTFLVYVEFAARYWDDETEEENRLEIIRR